MAPEDSSADSTEDEVAAAATAAIDELAHRGSAAAFQLLIQLNSHLGTALGECARRVAEHGSWTDVAALSGTSKQAAWSRWR